MQGSKIITGSFIISPVIHPHDYFNRLLLTIWEHHTQVYAQSDSVGAFGGMLAAWFKEVGVPWFFWEEVLACLNCAF
jgi:hypothetical protein